MKEVTSIEQQLFDITGILEINSWQDHRNALGFICDHFEAEQTTADSIPAGPNSATFRATRSGFIEVREKHSHRGGYYGCNRYLPYALVVGRRVDGEIDKQISALVEELVRQSGKLTCGDKNGHFHDTFGTNFSTYGFAV